MQRSSGEFPVLSCFLLCVVGQLRLDGSFLFNSLMLHLLYSSTTALLLHATAAYLVDDCQLVSHVAGYDRPTSTRVVFHGPTLGSPTGALQPLDRGFGTVCRPGYASPTMTLENFIGS